MKLDLHTFNITEEDRTKIIIENLKMGIADAKVEGQSNAYAINNNKVEISQEIIIILLIIFVLIALWKFLQHYIKKQIVKTNVQTV